MRRLLSPRWLLIHLLAVLAFVACLLMCWWQLTRARGGNALSWGYTFEWPVFGVFALVFWARLIRDELRKSVGRDGGEAARDGRGRIRTAVLGGPPAEPERIRRVERAVPTGPADDTDDELAAYNSYLAWRTAHPDRRAADYPG